MLQERGWDAPERLPRRSWRDLWNEFRQDFKFQILPFRAFYRFRAHFYARSRYPELRLIKTLADPAKIGLDVGANLGLYTYFLARACRHVYAFEPNPNPLHTLRAVADRNVTVLPIAMSNRSGEAELTVPRGRRGWTNNGATLCAGFAGPSMTLKVPARRIDDLGLTDIGIIKIDVEGYELGVLEGASETLARERPVLLVENEITHVGGNFAQVFEFLAGAGYGGFFIENGLLQTLSRFSVEAHQIAPLKPGGDRRRYVRNFIFLPQ